MKASVGVPPARNLPMVPLVLLPTTGRPVPRAAGLLHHIGADHGSIV
jgi:hypothetical protein